MAYLGNNPRTKLWNVDTTEEVDAKIASAVAGFDALPTQSGQTGKYLSTDGADASWETITQYTPPTNQGSGNFLSGDGTYKAIDVSTDIATAVAALVDSAPSTLDTLNELAASLGDDANFATTVSTSLGTKVDKTTTVNGHALSGNVTVTKSDVSLGNVDNTSDANKPISTAQQTALNLKADSSTVTSHTGNTSNPHSVTKAQVGLGSVDNTADSAKPISTAQQTALNLKANLTNADFSGNTSAMMAMTADNIPVGTSTTIPSGKQLVVDHLDVLGTLDVQGTLATVTGGYLSQTTMKTQAIAHTNGTNAINIDSVGNIGIGTSSPIDGDIHVHNTENVNTNIKFTNNATGQTATDGFFVGIGTNGDAYVHNREVKSLNLSTSDSVRMTIDSAGRVTMPYQPAFQAQASNSDTTYGIGYVPYPNIIFNHGNYYNASTSTFTAPVTGVYFFSWSTWHNEASTGRTYLHKNNAAYKSTGTDNGPHVRLSNTDVNAYGSAQMLVELNANDTVRIYNGEGNIRLFYANAFSGYLIG